MEVLEALALSANTDSHGLQRPQRVGFTLILLEQSRLPWAHILDLF